MVFRARGLNELALSAYEDNQRSLCALLIWAHAIYVIFAERFIFHLLAFSAIYVSFAALAYVNRVYTPGILKKPFFQKGKARIIFITIIHILIMLSSLVPRVLVFFVGWNHQVLLLIVLPPVYISQLLLTPYIRQFSTEFHLNMYQFGCVFYANFAVLVASIRIAHGFSSSWDYAAISFVQVLFTPILFFACQDLTFILMKRIQNPVPVVQNPVQAQNPPAPAQNPAPPQNPAPAQNPAPVRNPPAPAVPVVVEEAVQLPIEITIDVECGICAQEYSDTLLPKVLTGCGHTVCSSCAHQLSLPHDKTCVFCPFCRRPSLTQGNESELPTNHQFAELLKTIRELREQPVQGNAEDEI